MSLAKSNSYKFYITSYKIIITSLCCVHRGCSVVACEGRKSVGRLPRFERGVGRAVHAAVVRPVGGRAGRPRQVGERVVRCVRHIIAVSRESEILKATCYNLSANRISMKPCNDSKMEKSVNYLNHIYLVRMSFLLNHIF